MSPAATEMVMQNVNRESQQMKVSGLMEYVPRLLDEMEHNEALQSQAIKITPATLSKLKDFSSYVGLVISSLQLFSLVRVDHYKERSLPPVIQKIVFVLGLVQGTSSGVLILLYIINKFTIYTKDKWRSYIEANSKRYKVLPNP